MLPGKEASRVTFPGAVLTRSRGIKKAKNGFKKNFSDVNKQPIKMVKHKGPGE
jgi:hypothetical protein